MAFNLVFECAIDQSTWLGSFDYYARVTRTSKTSFQFFSFYLFFSLPIEKFPLRSFLPSFSFSILFYPKLRRRNPLLRNRSNDFYVIKKYFRLSIFILITSQRTFKWETKIISFVYLPRLGVIAVIASIFCCSFSIDIVSRL